MPFRPSPARARPRRRSSVVARPASTASYQGSTSFVRLRVRLFLLLLLTTTEDRALTFIVEATFRRRVELHRVNLALLLAEHVGDRIADDDVGYDHCTFGQLQAAKHA